MRFADYSPPNDSLGQATQWLADEIYKRTNGRVKWEIFFSGTLAKPGDIPDAVKSGLADAGTLVAAYKPAALPLFNFSGLPFATASGLVVGQAINDVAINVPALQQEMKSNNVKYLTSIFAADFQLALRKPIKTLDDLKGMKIRTHGDIFPKLIQALGATAVGLVPAEIYEALQRGTVDGLINYEDAVYNYKWYEVAKYMAITHMGVSGGGFRGINLDVWNKLSPEDQKIIEQVSSEHTAKLEGLLGAGKAAAVNEMKAKGWSYIDLPASDLAKLKDLAMPLWDEWGKGQDAKGLAGTEVIKTYRAALAKYEKK